MAKGARVQLNYQVQTDPDTGATLTRLTPADVCCHRNYFYMKCFSNDGNKLLFGGAFDNDTINCWLLDLPSGKALQLTEGRGDNIFGCFLSPDECYVYYFKNGREQRRVRLADLYDEAVYTVPEGWKGYGTWVANSDCSKLVGIEMWEADQIPLSDWSLFAAQYHKQPRCRLIVVDIASGERSVLFDEARWIGHPMFRPQDDGTLAYCHEGPHDLVTERMWLINADGSQRRSVKQQAAGESCTHEFWVPDGSQMLYVSYRKGSTDRWICAVNPATLGNRELMTMPPCSHLMSNHDGSLLVGDGSDTPTDVSDVSGHEHANDPFLYLFDLKANASRRIAAHHSSWKVHRGSRQMTHPHPSFTPDNAQVLFTSDFEGEPALYLAAIPSRE